MVRLDKLRGKSKREIPGKLNIRNNAVVGDHYHLLPTVVDHQNCIFLLFYAAPHPRYQSSESN